MRLFRVCKAEEPTDWDLQSHEARGKRPPRDAPLDLVRDWPRLSTFSTLAMARAMAVQAHLGDWVAELDVPAEVEKRYGANKALGRHVSLLDTTPDEIRGYIVAVTRIPHARISEVD